jgi:hypothetical protein
MAKVTWIVPSKDDPIYSGQFVLSSRKISPELVTAEESAEESAEAKVSTDTSKKKIRGQKKPGAKNKPLDDLS